MRLAAALIVAGACLAVVVMRAPRAVGIYQDDGVYLTTGQALASSVVYDVYTQAIIKSEDGNLPPMSTPRAGASAIASSPRGIVFGGAQATGLGSPAGALSSAELFDPTGGGLWAAVPADSVPEAEYEETLAKAGGFFAALNLPHQPEPVSAPTDLWWSRPPS